MALNTVGTGTTGVSPISPSVSMRDRAWGVRFERHEGMPRDGLGIATFPNGDRVAWFLDPDGNVLSITTAAASR